MKNLPVILLGILLTLACSGHRNDPALTGSGPESLVEPDSVFTALFIRNCCGFTGGDGTYSVLLPDGRTVWIFGDTFLGTVNPDLTRPRLSPMYIRNSFVVQDGDSLTTLYRARPDGDASMVVPPTGPGGKEPREDSVWFWPGDGLIEEGKLKVFLSQFTQPDTGMWGFQWEGTWLATFSLPEIEQESLEELFPGRQKEIHYGHAVLEEPDYTYVYGAGNGKPFAARYPAGDIHRRWEFFNGTSWTYDPSGAAPMGTMHASEQFSVLKIGDKYAFVTQSGSLGTDIFSYVSDTPVGPWTHKTLIYTTPIPGNNKNLFTYNALVHPQFIENGRILLSYNMNSYELGDHFRNADIYRPRFVRVPLKLIVQE